MSSLIERIGAHKGRGFVRADAGFGKTHLIADAVEQLEGSHLVLTHTHAGVDAIKKKLKAKQIPTHRFRVDTIAGFVLRLCLAYRGHSKWSDPNPTGEGWDKLYDCCQLLLRQTFLHRILNASFKRLLVDEYQDCSNSQHDLVMGFSEHLPTIVLGDPLQGIFDWNGMVNWQSQVEATFTSLGTLEIPYRWRNAGAEELGDWLVKVRLKLEHNERIDLTDAPRNFVNFKQFSESELRIQQVNSVRYFSLPQGQTLVAIHGSGFANKAKCHHLAKKTSGVCSSIEEVEGTRLRDFVRRFDAETEPGNRLRLLLTFLKDNCTSGVARSLSAGSMRGERAKIGRRTKNAAITELANDYIDNPICDNLIKLQNSLRGCSTVTVYAKDLWARLRDVLLEASSCDERNLQAAFTRFQSRFRHRGRPIHSHRIVATTLLIKGLQYDHAIILDATSLSKKDFYVAITRGSRSLTILSTERIIQPQN